VVSLLIVVTLVTNITTDFPVTMYTYVIFISLIYLLTPSSTVLLEKLTDSQLVRKNPAFYGT
jgi:hypothetical protein